MRRFSGVKACSFNPSQVFTAGVNASEVSVNASEVSVNASEVSVNASGTV
ncbi:MAG: hypothetical protein MR971_05515 [Bacteroidales bacterium]|nr:hypothetical protein [Bacteroidales bacterium]